MSFKSIVLATIASLLITSPVMAGGGLEITGAYARSSTSKSTSGAAFLSIVNNGVEDDRLIAAHSDIAKRIELHTHKEGENGVMRMMEIEGGIAVDAGGHHALKRGGDHIMLMGLTMPLAQGDVFPLTLTFEKAGDIEIEIPVDLNR